MSEVSIWLIITKHTQRGPFHCFRAMGGAFVISSQCLLTDVIVIVGETCSMR